MQRALSFSALLLAASVFSLSLKDRFNDYSVTADEARLVRDISAKLRSQNFLTTAEPHLFPEKTVVASRGNCRLRVTNGTRANQLRSVLVAQSRLVGVPRYYFEGRWNPEPPVVQSELSRYWQLIASRLGFPAPRDVMLAVASSPQCVGQSFDLSGIKVFMADKS
ncbi:MAG: hypothetical protein NVSMB6_31030 [Burkholderiaceae bacterium]